MISIFIISYTVCTIDYINCVDPISDSISSDGRTRVHMIFIKAIVCIKIKVWWEKLGKP